MCSFEMAVRHISVEVDEAVGCLSLVSKDWAGDCGLERQHTQLEVMASVTSLRGMKRKSACGTSTIPAGESEIQGGPLRKDHGMSPQPK